MMRKTLKKQSGFSLIEVLIAVIILAIGMLAFAASAIMGQRGTHGALYRSHATLLANDLAERIHANPNGDYTRAINCANLNSACAATNGVAAVSCDANTMADFDLAEWFCGRGDRSGVSGLLRAPENEVREDENGNLVQIQAPPFAQIVCIDRDPNDADACTPGSSFSIRLNWSERDANRARERSIENESLGRMINRTLEIVASP